MPCHEKAKTEGKSSKTEYFLRRSPSGYGTRLLIEETWVRIPYVACLCLCSLAGRAGDS